MIQKAMFHLIVPVSAREGIVGFAEMPLPSEECLITTQLEHRSERPFSGGQATALALKGHSGHAASVGITSGYDRSAARRAAGLAIVMEKRHSFFGKAIEAGRRHAAP